MERTRVFDEQFITRVCEGLCAQMTIYPPAYVIHAVLHSTGDWIARGTNLTVYGMTIRMPAHVERALASWYRPSIRGYLSTLRAPSARVFLAHLTSRPAC